MAASTGNVDVVSESINRWIEYVGFDKASGLSMTYDPSDTVTFRNFIHSNRYGIRMTLHDLARLDAYKRWILLLWDDVRNLQYSQKSKIKPIILSMFDQDIIGTDRDIFSPAVDFSGADPVLFFDHVKKNFDEYVEVMDDVVLYPAFIEMVETNCINDLIDLSAVAGDVF